MAQLDQDSIWKIVKEIRKSFLSRHLNPECGEDYVVTDHYISGNIDHFAKELKLSPSSIPRENVSHQTFETAGEIYAYLNYCPPNLGKISKNKTNRS